MFFRGEWNLANFVSCCAHLKLIHLGKLSKDYRKYGFLNVLFKQMLSSDTPLNSSLRNTNFIDLCENCTFGSLRDIWRNRFQHFEGSLHPFDMVDYRWRKTCQIFFQKLHSSLHSRFHRNVSLLTRWYVPSLVHRCVWPYTIQLYLFCLRFNFASRV